MQSEKGSVETTFKKKTLKHTLSKISRNNVKRQAEKWHRTPLEFIFRYNIINR